MAKRFGRGRTGALLIQEYFGFGLGEPVYHDTGVGISVSAPTAAWVPELYHSFGNVDVNFQLSIPYGGCSLAAICAMPDPHKAIRLLKAWAWELDGYVEPIEDQLYAIGQRCPSALNRRMRKRVKLWLSKEKRKGA